jgi:quinol monooxygenase YgiN
MSLTVIVNFRAAEGKAEALLPLLRTGRDFSLKAEGCEAFDLYQGEDDPHQFVMVERWTSLEAHHANFETNVRASGHLDKILPLLSEPIRSGVYGAV